MSERSWRGEPAAPNGQATSSAPGPALSVERVAPAADPAVPFVDLAAEYRAVAHRVEPAVLRVLRSGHYVLGREVAAFEAAAAEALGVRHAIGVNSGTDALVLALRALGIGAGDEVITSPLSFLATASSVRLVGARPVFADIDPRTYLLDPEDVAARITPATKAVLPVALFGQPADMGRLRELTRAHGLHLIEDAAQAFGARLDGRPTGALGDLTAFSFYPTKNLGACGDGGLVTTDDERLAEAVRALRSHGSAAAAPEAPGFNSRLDEVQAAVLAAKLPELERWNAARRANAAAYDDAFRGLEGIEPPAVLAGATHVYHQYAVRVTRGDRAELAERLAAAGVETRTYYPVPLHRQGPAEEPRESLPHAERASGELLCLPISPTLTRAGLERCAAVVRGYARIARIPNRVRGRT